MAPRQSQRRRSIPNAQPTKTPAPVAPLRLSSKVAFYPPSDTHWRIGGEWYDFTNFNHPGGAKILALCRDRFEDCTYVFESHHMNYKRARKIIAKYKVDGSKVVTAVPPKEVRAARGNIALPALLDDSAFYSVFRLRVQKYLDSVGCSDGGPTGFAHALFWAVLASFVACCVGLYVYATPAWSCGCALTGAWLGAFGHNWTHQPKYYERGYGILSLDMVGFSSETWAREHNLQHHAYTNTPADNHFKGTDPFLKTDPTSRRHWLQAWVTPPLHHLVLACGVYGNWIIHTVELLAGRENLSIGKLILPTQLGAMYWRHGTHGLALCLLAHALMSIYYFTMALMNHNAEHCHDVDARNASTDWGTHQLVVCADWCRDWGYLSSMIFLWLNLHGVHHLVPKLDASHHPAVQRILIQTSKEFGVVYHADASFLQTWLEMLRSFHSPLALGKEILAYNGQI